jgi:glyoxylate reductase
MPLTLSLATEHFPGLNEALNGHTLLRSGAHHVVRLAVEPESSPRAIEGQGNAATGGQQEIEQVTPAASRLLSFARTAPYDAKLVVAFHVGIADSLDAVSLSRLRASFPRANLLTNFGVGLDHIDLIAARDNGFRVVNTPDVLTDATADVALLLLLLATRRAMPALEQMREHGHYEGWKPVARHMGVGLVGKTLGLAGYGRIARALARRAEALGMHVVVMRSARVPASEAASTTLVDGPFGAQTVVRLPEKEFLAACDVLSLHFPAAPQTRGWLDARRLALLKPGAFVINTARGEVVDEEALASALREGRLAGAGLDVFAGEPVLSETLRGAPNVVVLPHVGSATWETRRAMGGLNRRALEDALDASLPE